MPTRQDPPADLRTAARRAGIRSFLGTWFIQDGLSDPRQYAGVRCHCVSGGKLVLLTRVESPSGAYRVGQCSGCRSVVWSSCHEATARR
jgi:hypothetical protein